MTDRVRHLTVVLEQDLRVDDLDAIANAIQHIRGVASVERHVVTGSDHAARMIARVQLQREIYDALEGVFRKD